MFDAVSAEGLDTVQNFGASVAKLLDEFEAADFRSAERILALLSRQGRTGPGFPRARPSDCERVTISLKRVFKANLPAFRTGDRDIVQRFEAIVEAVAETDIRFYPRELLRVRMLQAEARMLLGDPAGARALIGDYADRPYKVEGGYDDLLSLMAFDCRARAAMGEVVEDLERVALARARLLCRVWPLRAFDVARKFVPFLSLGRPSIDAGWLGHATHWASGMTARARVRPGTITAAIARLPAVWFGHGIVGLLLLLTRTSKIVRRRSGDVLVTRAMGGIGDLFMMTAGLRALSRRIGKPVKLVIDRKFFDIFRNNPHVDLVDIDSAPIAIEAHDKWFNLTRCPAAFYESRRVPAVRKGRTELFARAMGIGRLALLRGGFNLDYKRDQGQIDFANAFIAKAGYGARPIVGIQPYSRDSYKDHSGILTVIERLRVHNDIILLHHIEAGLPAGPGLVSTAGLSLAQSISLVAVMDAMISVDSGFLHAAAAFDIPVVALFGPTDGRLFTRHHRHVVLLQPRERFPCSPCWRNEDTPCQLTGQFGPSPCVGALAPDIIEAALSRALKMGRGAPPTSELMQRSTAPAVDHA